MLNKEAAKRLAMMCNIALLLTAFIFGMSFVAQKAGMEYVGPFTFNSLRFFIGSFSLFIVMLIGEKFNFFEGEKHCDKELVKGGCLAGLALFLAYSINQFCMQYAEAGKAGFITSLYIIFVPIICVFMKRNLTWNVQVGIVLAIVGLYLLCSNGVMGFELCDIGLLIAALFFALHIIVLSFYTKKVGAIKLSCFQFLVAGILSTPIMFLLETPHISEIVAGIKPILFIGVVVTALAYTLQVFGQKAAKPVHATMILSSESVFAVLGGIIFLGESLNLKEISGCILMIIAIVISQLQIKLPECLRKFGR